MNLRYEATAWCELLLFFFPLELLDGVWVKPPVRRKFKLADVDDVDDDDDDDDDVVVFISLEWKSKYVCPLETCPTLLTSDEVGGAGYPCWDGDSSTDA